MMLLARVRPGLWNGRRLLGPRSSGLGNRSMLKKSSLVLLPSKSDPTWLGNDNYSTPRGLNL